MSYAVSGPLQRSIYQLLAADAGLAALIGNAIHDSVPAGPVEGTHVIVGDEDVRDRSVQAGSLAEHRLKVSVVSDKEGYAEAKSVAALISDALRGAAPVLDRGRVVTLSFLRARARRVRAGQIRRIDLTFRIIVEDD